jgi:hypothetical protein
MPDKRETFTIHYHERTDKPTIPVTGAYGSATPDGNVVVAHVYVDHLTVPSHVTHPVDEGGNVRLAGGSEVKRSEMTREIQATLVLTPEAAASLGNFLVQQAAMAANMRKTLKGDEE